MRVRVCRAAILDGAAQFSSGVVRNEKPQKPDKTVSAVFVVYTLPPGQKRNVQGRPYYDYTRYNDGRLDAFAQLDLRIDKTFYFRHCMLGLYIDLQNVTGSKLRQPDVLMSTGVVENPEAPAAEQRYRMKYIRQESGTLIPTLGITVEF